MRFVRSIVDGLSRRVFALYSKAVKATGTRSSNMIILVATMSGHGKSTTACGKLVLKEVHLAPQHPT